MVRSGLIACSVLALLVGCSSKTADLGRNGDTQEERDGGGSGGGSGAAGAPGDVPDATPGHEGGLPPSVIPDAPDGSAIPDPTGSVSRSHKLDLLLVVDNSISMADKQNVLKQTIPDLVHRVTSPSFGVTDLHVAVITSSLGGHGSTLCQGRDDGTLADQEANDHGHSVATRPRFAGTAAAYPDAQQPTPEGILAWTSTMSATALESGIQRMVDASGEFGCGLESQLEAMYRFLADPAPPDHIAQQNCPGSNQPCAVPVGRDDALLAQRSAFLRPDSIVAVVQLSDENDCSIQDGKQWFYPARDDITLPPSTSVCATNPNDPCCHSCASAPRAGCPANADDPGCQQANSTEWARSDALNLRCFDQKRRFGVDFLYPPERYSNALTHAYLCTSRADLAAIPSDCPDLDGDAMPDIRPNPLFVSSNPGITRDRSLVYLLGIVGVPAQDLAKAGAASLTYQSPSELTQNGTWDVILGNPIPGGSNPPVRPSDVLMVESVFPRGGNDGQGNSLAQPDSNALANPVNGHEWGNLGQDDLQYACIFPLPTPRDCNAVAQMPDPQAGCDCKPPLTPGDMNPLCQNPSTNQYETRQYFAKAYPGLRHLSVLRAMGSQGLTASICATNLTDDSKDDYGYRPAIDSLLSQLQQRVP